MNDLALQVAEVDHVEVNDADGADAGGSEIHRGRRAEPAGADAQHLGRLELALTLDADLRHDKVPAVSLDLISRQFGQDPLFLTEHRRCPAGNGRNDAHGVAFLQRRLVLLQIPDVIVIYVDVDETAKLAVGRVEMLFKTAVLRCQILQEFGNSCAIDLYGVLLFCKRSKRSRNQNLSWHKSRLLDRRPNDRL